MNSPDSIYNWSSIDEVTLQAEIKLAEDTLARSQEDLKQATAALERSKPAIAMMERMHTMVEQFMHERKMATETSGESPISGVAEDAVAGVINNIRRFREACAIRISNQESYARSAQLMIRQIQTKRMELENPGTTIDIDKVEAELLRFDKYVPGSLYVAADEHNNVGHLNFCMDGVRMTPLYNSCMSFIPSAKGILLPKISVQVAPDGDVRIHPSHSDEGWYMFTSSERSAHPHVLYHGKPCWGDFASPVVEACEVADIGSLFLITQSYLETCDPGDGAGRKWPHLLSAIGNFDYHRNVNPHHENAIYNNVDEDGEETDEPVLQNPDECESTELTKYCENPFIGCHMPVLCKFNDADELEWRFVHEDKNIWYPADGEPDYSKELAQFATVQAMRVNKQKRKHALNESILAGA